MPAFGTAFASAAEPAARRQVCATGGGRSYARFVEQGIPTTRAEDWKYTNVAKAANVPLAMAPKAELGLDAIAPYLLGGPQGAAADLRQRPHRARAQPRAEPAARRAGHEPAARAAGRAATGSADVLAIVEDERSFTALNGAFAGAGAWIELDDGADAEDPLQLLFLTVGQPSAFMSHPRDRRASRRRRAAAADREPCRLRRRRQPDQSGEPDRPRRRLPCSSTTASSW